MMFTEKACIECILKAKKSFWNANLEVAFNLAQYLDEENPRIVDFIVGKKESVGSTRANFPEYTLKAHVHTHPNALILPSPQDLVLCVLREMDSYIINEKEVCVIRWKDLKEYLTSILPNFQNVLYFKPYDYFELLDELVEQAIVIFADQ